MPRVKSKQNTKNEAQESEELDFTAQELTPQEIVTELDAHIIGQTDAKRAVAIAVRNRWRRRQLPEELRDEISPKNILMIGPTGVGKTEMARRLARLTNAPFVKVEATKYTEVGYYGRDVESMIRDLVENAISIVRYSELNKVLSEAEAKVEERILDILTAEAKISSGTNSARKSKKAFSPVLKQISLDEVPPELQEELKSMLGPNFPKGVTVHQFSQEISPESDEESAESIEFETPTKAASNSEDGKNAQNVKNVKNVQSTKTAKNNKNAKKDVLLRQVRKQLKTKLRDGLLENREIEIQIKQKSVPPFLMNIAGGDSMGSGLSEVLDQMLPPKTVRQTLPIREARKVLLEKECDELVNDEKIQLTAVELAENSGIIFLDEIDKIVSSNSQHGADVSRQGVQRDLLPIVEGTTIQTRYGYVRTNHILFIAAGAFHQNKPGDLMPELQGRFPIRVELQELTQEDFRRILTEPKNSLLHQYEELLQTEGVRVIFQEDAIHELANYAWKLNQTSQNIGARRLYTILEHLLEEISFTAPEMKKKTIKINAEYVRQKLEDVVKNEDISKFIL